MKRYEVIDHRRHGLSQTGKWAATLRVRKPIIWFTRKTEIYYYCHHRQKRIVYTLPSWPIMPAYYKILIKYLGDGPSIEKAACINAPSYIIAWSPGNYAYQKHIASRACSMMRDEIAISQNFENLSSPNTSREWNSMRYLRIGESAISDFSCNKALAISKIAALSWAKAQCHRQRK